MTSELEEHFQIKLRANSQEIVIVTQNDIMNFFATLTSLVSVFNKEVFDILV